MYRPCHGRANLAMGYLHNHPTSSPPSSLPVVVVAFVVVVVLVVVAAAVAVVVVFGDCACWQDKIGEVVVD